MNKPETDYGFGVYIHFPYCRKRCPYCDFSVAVSQVIPHVKYADWVIDELSKKAHLFAGRKLRSIYLGGGTPSLWDVFQVQRVLSKVRELFSLEGVFPLEITLECDPKDISLDRLYAYRSIGVSRLSLGIQSFNDKHLKTLGRLHDATQAQNALYLIRDAGFTNWTADLMIGLPSQTIDELFSDIETMISFAPPHISVYQLTIEPKTSFAAWVERGTLQMPPDDFQQEAYILTQDKLRESGFMQYEISSYARGGQNQFRSLHNQLYWQLGEYLGVGVSAHSFRLLPDGSAERFWNPRSLRAYEKAQSQKPFLPLTGEHEPLSLLSSAIELQKDALWLGLRHLDGINHQVFERRFEKKIYDVCPLLAQLCVDGFLIDDKKKIALTSKGVLFADWVALKIVEQ